MKCSDADETFWDETLPAFGVRVGKRRKTFIVIHDGGRRTKLGTYPETSLQDARKAAKLALATPSAPRTQKAQSIAVREAVDLFIDTRKQKNRATSAKAAEQLLQRCLLPEVGSLKITEVTTDKLATIIDGLSETPAAANFAFTGFRTFFNWAVARRYIANSPMAGLSMPNKAVVRSRVLSDTELARIYHAAVQVGYPFGHMILICIHTGLRRGEVAAMKWSYITPDTITIPAEISKNGEQHIIPNLIMHNFNLIPRQVQRMLVNGTVMERESEFLFPSDVNTPFSAWSKNKARFDMRCNVTDWVLHDLRRTFSTKMAEWQLAPPHVIERILNHTTGSLSPIAKVYNRWNYLTDMRQALDAYERRLAQLLEAHSATSIS